MFVQADHTVWATGCNGNGQLGLGHTTATALPTPVACASAAAFDVVAVLCGYNYTLFLTSDNAVWATGCNGNGQLGLGHTDQQNTPTLVAAIGHEVSSLQV
jgi:alpha-tubulin suppressor-like RCC1 family protein